MKEDSLLKLFVYRMYVFLFININDILLVIVILLLLKQNIKDCKRRLNYCVYYKDGEIEVLEVDVICLCL